MREEDISQHDLALQVIEVAKRCYLFIMRVDRNGFSLTYLNVTSLTYPPHPIKENTAIYVSASFLRVMWERDVRLEVWAVEVMPDMMISVLQKA